MMEPSTSLNGLPEPESPRHQQESLQLQLQQQQQDTLPFGVQPTDQLQASVAGVEQSTTAQEESQSNNRTTNPLTWKQQQGWLDQSQPSDVPLKPLTSMSDAQPAEIAPAPLAPSSSSNTGGLPGNAALQTQEI
ncbi:uncharacterized protein LOC119743306 [Patiria miniata]|uniref:Uncharacterized protein n=1 Tax=Patiria miniata TaxID=46514 RepID=A0A914BH96_PATMI|nr:uncharacterized protein LOC119743306 [Patiria miniata]